MFHEMEELIGFRFFLKQNREELRRRFPSIYKKCKDYSTEACAVAVYEQFLLCIIISCLAYFLDMDILWYIWLGAFIGCDVHFFNHLIQMRMFRRYVPSSITSLVCLPINTLIICKCVLCIQGPYMPAIAFIILGGVLVFINNKIAEKLYEWFTRKTRSL